MDHPHATVWTEEAAPLDRPELLIIAKSMIAARRAIHGSLPSELLHDTALDFLLNLFVSQTAGDRIEIERLIPTTTAAPHIASRWINVLVQYNLAESDGSTASLTDSGIEAVTAMLRAVAASQWHLDSPA